MINPSTTVGKVLLVFFWGTLSAEIVLIFLFLSSIRNDVAWIVAPFLTVVVNMILIAIKNLLDPGVKNL